MGVVVVVGVDTVAAVDFVVVAVVVVVASDAEKNGFVAVFYCCVVKST